MVLAGLFVLSLWLAWTSTGSQSLDGWISFLLVLVLCSGLAAAGWWLLRGEQPPGWLAALTCGAILLRLALGAVWYTAIPRWGHGTPAESAGYVMGDASARDQAAWKLAQSAKPLWKAFQDNRKVDQYGGMLFLSALAYRYIAGDVHQPLLMVVVSATFSGLAVLFTWAFSKRAWGRKTAWLAGWFIVLYPEAVLLGSSQMREAFMVTLTMGAFYGLLRYLQDRSLAGLAWILMPLLLYLPFSPPFAALLTGMLALTALVYSNQLLNEAHHRRRLWLIFGALLVLVLVGLWFALRQFVPQGMNNPLEMLSWWIRKSAGLQAYLSQHSSGWMQKIFRSTPEWSHLPLLVAYGVVQPFLPAALVVGSHAPIWPWIAAWRAIGWTILLTLLIYAPLLALRSKEDRGMARVMSLIVWASILVASFRGGGDMWDNPRYRTAFAGLQAALAAWAWIDHRRLADPWLRRALLSTAAILAWFLPWYLRRYTLFEWPVVDLFKTLGLGFASAFLIILWDWARTFAAGVREKR
jgi:hypothetical protein